MYETFIGSDNKFTVTKKRRKLSRFPRNISANNFGNFETLSEARHPRREAIGNLSTTRRGADDNENENVSNKMGKKLSLSRRKRKKGGRSNKWIVSDVTR